jgi:hypothetical protein
MAKPPKEYQAFDSLVSRLLTVPKSTIHERHAEHKKKAALNPKKRGPKPKVTRRAGHGRATESED